MKFNDKNLLLYAVTDRSWLSGRSLCHDVECALQGGATMVQLREKTLSGDALFAQAQELSALCKRYGVPLLINDDPQLAVACGADGVHVGQGDLSAQKARAILGEEKILGVTARTVEQAQKAERDGADYLGVGAVFGSTTKEDAQPLSFETLQEICASVSLPIVAIGGVSLQNLPRLSGAGVSGVAVISSIFSAKDITAECRLLLDASKKMVCGG